MTIASPNPHPVPTYDLSAVTTAPDKHRLYLRARARRAALRARHALVCLARRAVSAPLGLSWRLDLTVIVDAEVVADDRETAMATLQEFLRRPQTRVVVSCPDRGPTGWRELGRSHIRQLRGLAAEDEGFPSPWITWSVTAAVTASIVVAARDADADCYGDIEPFIAPQSISRLIAADGPLIRTPVRRRHHR